MKKGNIPTKAELLRLQKLYKTDEKIGERLGGAPAYLVAYWRRKKDVPKYSLPKFSEIEVRNLWERYGDDEKAGLELGISKAAFYNWRRRYGLRQKPEFLKLEQLELNFPGLATPSHTNSLYGKRTVAQKILARLAGLERVGIGQEVEIEPDLTVTPGGASSTVREFVRNSERVWNPSRIVLLPGHTHDLANGSTAEGHLLVRDFARRQSIKAFYDLNEGNCPQIALERGHVTPGSMILGTGRHTLAYGALSALAVAVSPNELAAVWAGGSHRSSVPETVRIVISGRRSRGVTAVDMALCVIKRLVSEDLAGKVIEYTGGVISQMSVGERCTLTMLSAETGALAAMCAYDAVTRRYLTGRTMNRFQPIVPDKDAEYRQSYQINIDQLTPQAAPYDKIAEVRPVAELRELPVQHIFLGGCTCGRFEDLRVAAEILRGHEVHEGSRLYIVPGSRSVFLEALKKGLIRVFVEAGAIVDHPGSVIGQPGHASGERGLTTFRLDSHGPLKGEVYFCSPATAAASALNGAITDPTGYGR
jgi:3-isopropylmalate/(R)-2-methylmalate dehydratase large subunit